MTITQKKLKELIDYNPKTGDFIWLNPPIQQKKLIGKVAGGICDGYKIIRIKRKAYKAHRLAFLYMTGDLPKYPEFEIDHINHIRDDNRWCNLKKVNPSENRKNISLTKSNSSGTTGVYWNKRERRWKAQIWENNKNIHLGYFINKKDAVQARQKANIEYGFHANHGKK